MYSSPKLNAANLPIPFFPIGLRSDKPLNGVSDCFSEPIIAYFFSNSSKVSPLPLSTIEMESSDKCISTLVAYASYEFATNSANAGGVVEYKFLPKCVTALFAIENFKLDIAHLF